MQNQNQSRLGHTCFPALGAGCVYSVHCFDSLIGSLYCLRFVVIGHCNCYFEEKSQREAKNCEKVSIANNVTIRAKNVKERGMRKQSCLKFSPPFSRYFCLLNALCMTVRRLGRLAVLNGNRRETELRVEAECNRSSSTRTPSGSRKNKCPQLELAAYGNS